MRRLLQRGSERILPAKAGEASEIVVSGSQFGVVFHGERGEVGIGGEIAGSSCCIQESTQDAGVLGAGMGNGHGRVIEPGLHEGKGRFDAERLVVQPCSCRDPQKSEDHDPGQEQCFAARKRLFQPGERGSIRRRVSIHRIDKKISVREYHFPCAIFRRISWSSSSEASWRALSTLK